MGYNPANFAWHIGTGPWTPGYAVSYAISSFTSYATTLPRSSRMTCSERNRSRISTLSKRGRNYLDEESRDFCARFHVVNSVSSRTPSRPLKSEYNVSGAAPFRFTMRSPPAEPPRLSGWRLMSLS